MLGNLKISKIHGDPYIVKSNEVIGFADLALRLKYDAENKIALGINLGVLRPLHCYKVFEDGQGVEMIEYYHFEFVRDCAMFYYYSYPDIFFLKEEVLILESELADFYKENTSIPSKRVANDENIRVVLNRTVNKIEKEYSDAIILPTQATLVDVILFYLSNVISFVISFILSGCYTTYFRQECKVNKEKYKQYTAEIREIEIVEENDEELLQKFFLQMFQYFSDSSYMIHLLAQKQELMLLEEKEANYQRSKQIEQIENLKKEWADELEKYFRENEAPSYESKRKLAFIEVLTAEDLQEFHINYPPRTEEEKKREIVYFAKFTKITHNQIGLIYCPELSNERSRISTISKIANPKK